LTSTFKIWHFRRSFVRHEEEKNEKKKIQKSIVASNTRQANIFFDFDFFLVLLKKMDDGWNRKDFRIFFVKI
tara:strand:+ start:2079 stop:2294 length:216 start_codon:yes stop_codon:yes gene_type:complete